MYKLLLCWRYLWTRYLALASVISVMLGVGTLVVVNSVMSGFSSKLLNRFRGLQSDLVVKSVSYYGFPNLEYKMRQIRERLGDRVKEVAPVIEAFAMAEYRFDRSMYVIKKPVKVIGVDPVTRAATSDFATWMKSDLNRQDPGRCFDVRGDALQNYQRFYTRPWNRPVDLPAGMQPPQAAKLPSDIVQVQGEKPLMPQPSTPPELPGGRLMGVVVGHALATVRNPKAHGAAANATAEDRTILHPGDIVRLTLATRDDIVGIDGSPRSQVAHTASFVVTDHFRCEMNLIDQMVVFVDLRDLQQLQAMHNMATTLEVRLADYDRDVDSAMADLKALFPDHLFEVKTWKEIGGPVISAIAIERSILNVLLFLIIAVAGFGILAIFFMIVVEKTRDIGILKALGASNRGIMGIFVGYGLLLGMVGAGLGTVGGICFTLYINEIEQFIARVIGSEVFPRDIYFFDKIPVDLNPWMLLWVNVGAIGIATAASVFPALRAALLHPVRALRFE
jgi:lipoprotein-releasing system permease protein